METQLKILNITKTKHAMKYSSLTNEMTEATEQSNRCPPIKTKPCNNNGVKVGGAPVSDTHNNKLYYSHHRNPMITERDPNYTSPATPFNSYYKHSTQNFKSPQRNIPFAFEPQPPQNQNCISKFPTFSSLDEKYSIIIGVCF